jgi:acyl-[acyl-carrier-protein]-phospholipid O-acyltransferase/long-chain-fatty-acid--[acyl-carrier-protein] ligase
MISHLKIEESLSEILGTGRCVVTGIPDESRGERLSVVYTSESVTPGQMVHALQSAGLPPLWIPKRDQFHKVDAIPVLGSGKVDLMAVRALARKRTECAEVLR